MGVTIVFLLLLLLFLDPQWTFPNLVDSNCFTTPFSVRLKLVMSTVLFLVSVIICQIFLGRGGEGERVNIEQEQSETETKKSTRSPS